jgi:hypothetical protein
MEEPQSIDQLVAHYAAVRRRLRTPPRPPPPSEPPPIVPGPIIPQQVNRTIQLVTTIAAKHELTLKDLVGKSRKNNVVNARHEAMWTLYTEHRRSLQFIANVFSNCNHTSVLHAVRRWRRIKELDDGR